MDAALAFHVGLNASLLSLGETYRSAGINWYIYHLLCHLPLADPGLQYTAFLSDTRFSPPQGMQVKRPAWTTTSPLKRILWEQLVAPVALRRERVDLLHAMAFVSPWMTRLPTIVTVFDLSFFQSPQTSGQTHHDGKTYHRELHRPSHRFYLRWMTRFSVQRATQVIAISEHTRQDVIARLGVPADRVQTVYCGVTPSFRPLPAADVAAFRRQKGLPDQFILFLGTIEPRKNVLRLIEAFHILASYRSDLPDLHLVIAGGKGWFFEPVFERVRELGLTDLVHFPGYVPEEEKCLWYNSAACFCYPSLYEGFGLPPLEAMACGTPVVASNAASLPEVVGDAGLTVAPDDVPALGDALYRVLTDDGRVHHSGVHHHRGVFHSGGVLHHPTLHDELAEKGKLRAQRFTWEECARRTTCIYRQAWQ